MYKGSCLCGAVRFELKSEPKWVSNCYCTMCQKQHGAVYATYVSVPKADLAYLAGVSAYQSSKTVTRKFCGRCGANVEWKDNGEFRDWASVPLGLLDTAFEVGEVIQLHEESKLDWLP